MSKKEKIIKNGEKNNTQPIFKNVTPEQIYEAEVCLALKLDALLDIMQKMYDLAEAKRTGTMSIN